MTLPIFRSKREKRKIQPLKSFENHWECCQYYMFLEQKSRKLHLIAPSMWMWWGLWGGGWQSERKMIYSISHIIVNILICSSKATLGGNKAAWAQFYLTELYLNFSWMDVFAVRLESTAFSHIFHLGLIYLPHACVTFTVYFLLGGVGGGCYHMA